FCFVGTGLVAIEVGWSYQRFASVIKWCTLVLLLYVVSGLLARPDWAHVLSGTLIPRLSLDKSTVTAAIAILGTTISPYMFFWITSEEVEEDKKLAVGTE